MSVGFDEFIPNILLEASDCPPEIAEHAILTTLRDFCRKTRIWQEELDAETLIAGLTEYDLTYDDEEVTKVAIMEARYNGVEIPVVSEKHMSKKVKGWRSDTADHPVCVVDLVGDKFRVYPTPTERRTSALELDVALMPSPNGSVVGDIVLNEFQEAIGFGALFRLQKMTGKEWSNPQNAMLNNKLYTRERNNAKNRVAKDFSNGALHVQSRKLSGSV